MKEEHRLQRYVIRLLRVRELLPRSKAEPPVQPIAATTQGKNVITQEYSNLTI